MSTAARARDHVLAGPPTLGTGRLVCIDGPSGSGKSTLAEQIVRIAPAAVVHTDLLCPGWDGLPAVPAILEALLAALAEGRRGSYREWDWVGDRPAGTVAVEPAALLILEGVGSGARALAPWIGTLIWVDADTAQRRARAYGRDGDWLGDRWGRWAAAEELYFAADDVRGRADLTVRTA